MCLSLKLRANVGSDGNGSKRKKDNNFPNFLTETTTSLVKAFCWLKEVMKKKMNEKFVAVYAFQLIAKKNPNTKVPKYQQAHAH